MRAEERSCPLATCFLVQALMRSHTSWDVASQGLMVVLVESSDVIIFVDAVGAVLLEDPERHCKGKAMPHEHAHYHEPWGGGGHTTGSAGGDLATMCHQSASGVSLGMRGGSQLTVRTLECGAPGSTMNARVQCTPDCLGHRSMKGCTGREPTSPVVAVCAVHYCPLVGIGVSEVDQLPDKLIDSLRLRRLHGTGSLGQAQT